MHDWSKKPQAMSLRAHKSSGDFKIILGRKTCLRGKPSLVNFGKALIKVVKAIHESNYTPTFVAYQIFFNLEASFRLQTWKSNQFIAFAAILFLMVGQISRPLAKYTGQRNNNKKVYNPSTDWLTEGTSWRASELILPQLTAITGGLTGADIQNIRSARHSVPAGFLLRWHETCWKARFKIITCLLL